MEYVTAAGAIFESVHRGGAVLGFHRHSSPFATIVLDGSYTEVRDGIARAASARSIVLHSADEQHADYFLGEARCLNVELPADAAIENSLELDAAVRAGAARLVRSFYTEPAQLEKVASEFHMLLNSRPRPSAESPPAWLQAVLEQFGWCDSVPLRDAAKLAGIHPVQFSRAFHRHVGVTSSEYRRQSRLRRASKLLLESTASLVSVANECGFADQSHLTRTFSESLGLSPGQYRQIFAR